MLEGDDRVCPVHIAVGRRRPLPAAPSMSIARRFSIALAIGCDRRACGLVWPAVRQISGWPSKTKAAVLAATAPRSNADRVKVGSSDDADIGRRERR